jgi:serine/threonine protein kinase
VITVTLLRSPPSGTTPDPTEDRSAVGLVTEEVVRASLFEAGYRVERILGRGGMGLVYAATQLSVGRSVAVKTLHRRLAADPVFVKRFVLEGRVTASLCGPHVVHAFDAGTTRCGIPFLVLELLEGETLAEQIARSGPIPPEAAAEAALAVSHALVEAHDRGILHRDVKPANVFTTRAGPAVRSVVKLLDFGVAKLEASALGTLTGSSYCVGSFAFMAPEQAVAPSRIDQRADVFSLGATLHALVTGKRPFGVRRNPALQERPRAPVPCSALERIIERCVAWEPSDRYPTMRAVREALLRWDA